MKNDLRIIAQRGPTHCSACRRTKDRGVFVGTDREHRHIVLCAVCAIRIGRVGRALTEPKTTTTSKKATKED